MGKGETFEGTRTGASVGFTEPTAPGEAASLSLLERYVFVRELGRGGMGVVEQVSDRILGRDVARKWIRADRVWDEAVKQRFIREIHTVARLDHPGVIPIYDSGEAPDRGLFFTMKLIRGQELQAWQPGVSLRARVAVLRWVCEAVGSAHRAGVVHRDLKPSNIMIGQHGEAYVVDWGIARMVGEAELHGAAAAASGTEAGRVLGTPSYMAPEQAAGQIDLIGPATDVYALGAILYRLLTGSEAFSGSRSEILRGIQRGPLRPVLASPEEEDLWKIIQEAMAADIPARPPDGVALARRLTGWLEGEQRRARASALVVQAEAMLPLLDANQERIRHLTECIEEQQEQVAPWEPLAARQGIWRLEDEVTTLRKETLQRELDYTGRLRAALSHDPDHPGAHAALAAYYQGRHRQAETQRDRDAALRLEAGIHRHDRQGRFDGYLSGEGRLTLHTEPPGAVVRLYHYTEHGRRLEPVEAEILGQTPLLAVPLPRGSHQLRIEAEGRPAVCYPVCLDRQEHWQGIPPGSDSLLPIWLPASLSDGECYIPAGWYRSGGDERAYNGLPAQRRWLDGFIIQRHPVTNTEYLTFLNDLLASGRRDEALAAAPRERPQAPGVPGRLVYGLDERDGFFLQADAEGDVWSPRWPVMMITWEAARAYAAWLSARTGLPWRLPSELEWEKAAGGVDGRTYPWGDHFEATWACVKESHRGRPLPAEIDAFPGDIGPYGVRGMAGNMKEWCLERFHPRRCLAGEPLSAEEEAAQRVLRGGAWFFTQTTARIATRYGIGQRNSADTIGFRLARSVEGPTPNSPG
jgi:serine/threonine protein kinase/formylglycine-generating enzyme required for sulfatase activity